jgi:Protein of unknown function (DUF3662)/FHA domain
MSVLRNLETKLAGLVEGTFGRVFRSQVRPAELARKLAKEMDDHRTVSVSRTYVPNEYQIWLSPEDRELYEGVEDSVREELSAYLLEHARREKVALISRPVITFHTDERLGLGEFGIHTRTVAAPVAPDEEQPQPARPTPVPRATPPPNAGNTMIFSSSERHREPLREDHQARGIPPRRALLLAEGKRMVVPQAGAIIGRSRDCDIVLGDPNISRQHAELRPDGAGGWTVADLGSTNGVRVNGQPTHGATPVRSGDRIDLGTVDMKLETE